VPLLNSTDPDVPDEPAFELATVTDPVLLLLLPPPKIATEPPVFPLAVVLPADSVNGPPTPLLPLPTSTLMAPPEPPVVNPVDTVTLPELPPLDDPVLSSTDPDVPADTALAETNDKEPVGPLVLPPDNIDTEPPTWLRSEAVPAAITTAPPVVPLEAPADITTPPPTPLVPLPTTKLIPPPAPLTADPDTRTKLPEFPDALVPLLNSNDPDAPNEAAFTEPSVSEPDELTEPEPAKIDTDPPV